MYIFRQIRMQKTRKKPALIAYRAMVHSNITFVIESWGNLAHSQKILLLQKNAQCPGDSATQNTTQTIIF